MKTSTIIIAIIGIAIIGYLIYKYVYLPKKTATTTQSTTTSNTISSSTTQPNTIASTNKNILTTKSQQLQQILRNSIVHKANPPSISTGIGKYIKPMEGIANPNGESKTINRNSYSYIQEIEKTNKPLIKRVSAITTYIQPQKTLSSSSSFIIHRPGLPTFSELKKQNPYLR
ncbi:MAG: hypothetical protein QXU98_08060 [Candidatus Parvarchaeota archaeon]